MHGVGLIYNNANENSLGLFWFCFLLIWICHVIKPPVSFLFPSADKTAYPK